MAKKQFPDFGKFYDVRASKGELCATFKKKSEEGRVYVCNAEDLQEKIETTKGKERRKFEEAYELLEAKRAELKKSCEGLGDFAGVDWSRRPPTATFYIVSKSGYVRHFNQKQLAMISAATTGAERQKFNNAAQHIRQGPPPPPRRLPEYDQSYYKDDGLFGFGIF